MFMAASQQQYLVQDTSVVSVQVSFELNFHTYAHEAVPEFGIMHYMIFPLTQISILLHARHRLA